MQVAQPVTPASTNSPANGWLGQNSITKREDDTQQTRSEQWEIKSITPLETL